MTTGGAKPYEIPKSMVEEAYRRVRANKGGPGVDHKTLEAFEERLEDNLYKIWNRMSSGSYMASPVRAVEIPKPHGDGVRVLGIPTIVDRVAQTVVAMHLEERVERKFHPDSYGYRPNRSALDAVGVCRERCWRKDWVVDIDIAKFFDTVPWDLILKAVEAQTDARWVSLYVQRWLAAPLQYADGTVVERDKGTPQGSAASPILANLFLHYAFDAWTIREFPDVQFERYVDDIVVHCVSEKQAAFVLSAIAKRMSEVGLKLHPEKTRIVYCQDGQRRGSYPHTSFTFLGFDFRQRKARNRKTGQTFSSFLPAVSKAALKQKHTTLRKMHIHRRTTLTLKELARWLNPIVNGWMQYYGRYSRAGLQPLLQSVNAYVMRWARKKYRRLRPWRHFNAWWRGLLRSEPTLFAQWKWTWGTCPAG